MKNNKSISSIDINSIDSLESYAFHLGVMCISVQTLMTIQEKAESLGIFDNDETEASKMMKYQIQRLYTCCDDLLRMCVQRSGQEWDDFKKKLVKRAQKQVATNSVDSGRKSIENKSKSKKRKS